MDKVAYDINAAVEHFLNNTKSILCVKLCNYQKRILGEKECFNLMECYNFFGHDEKPKKVRNKVRPIKK